MNTLTDREKRQLRSKGWTNADIDRLSDDDARDLISAKVAKPGSRRAAAAVAASIGMPGLPEQYTNEGEAARLEGKDTADTYVLRDDFEANLEARKALRKMGSGVPIPTDEIAQPYVDANPDLAFRWMTKPHVAKRGTRGWTPVYDQKGKKVTHLNEDRYLAKKPRDVRDAQLREYQQAGEANYRAAREAMDSTVDRMAAENAGTGMIRPLSGDQMSRLNNRG